MSSSEDIEGVLALRTPQADVTVAPSRSPQAGLLGGRRHHCLYPQCLGTVWRTWKELLEHGITTHRIKGARFICPWQMSSAPSCSPNEFNTFADVLTHIHSNHAEDLPALGGFEYLCPFSSCEDYAWTRVEDRNTHIGDTHRTNGSQLLCPYEDQTNSHPYGLIVHLEKVHDRKDPQLWCPFPRCPDRHTFRIYRELRDHGEESQYYSASASFRTFKCPCAHCPKANDHGYDRWDRIHAHIFAEHSSLALDLQDDSSRGPKPRRNLLPKPSQYQLHYDPQSVGAGPPSTSHSSQDYQATQSTGASISTLSESAYTTYQGKGIGPVDPVSYVDQNRNHGLAGPPPQPQGEGPRHTREDLDAAAALLMLSRDKQ